LTEGLGHKFPSWLRHEHWGSKSVVGRPAATPGREYADAGDLRREKKPGLRPGSCGAITVYSVERRDGGLLSEKPIELNCGETAGPLSIDGKLQHPVHQLP